MAGYFNAIHLVTSSSSSKTDLSTSVQKTEEFQSNLSGDQIGNKFEAEPKVQPINKQHSPRNDGDQIPNGMSKFYDMQN